MIKRIRKLLAVLLIAMMSLVFSPTAAFAADASLVIGSGLTLQSVPLINGALSTAFSSAVPGDTVTVSGALDVGGTGTLTMNIPTGVTVKWEAEYQGNNSATLILLSGDGIFQVASSSYSLTNADGPVIQASDYTIIQIDSGTVSSVNSTAIRITGDSDVIVNGGTVSGDPVGIETYNGMVTVNGGSVSGGTTGVSIINNGGAEINSGVVSGGTHAINNGNSFSSPVDINGGFLIRYYIAIQGPRTLNQSAPANAVIVSWNYDAWFLGGSLAYTEGDTSHLTVEPAGSAEWRQDSPTRFGVSYSYNGNSSFYQISGVTVKKPQTITPATYSAAPYSVGNQITAAQGTYSPYDGGAAGTHTYKWYRADDAAGTGAVEISGATNLAYTPVAADFGKYICIETTPIGIASPALPGMPVKSAYIQVGVKLIATASGGGGGTATVSGVADTVVYNTTPVSIAVAKTITTDTVVWTDNGAGGSFGNTTADTTTYTPPTNPAGDITLTAALAYTPYPILTYFLTFTGSGDQFAKIDADDTQFQQLIYGGSSVAVTDYDVTPGSTVITLHESYLRTLANGTYIYRAEFLYGYADLTLVVNVPPPTPASSQTGGNIQAASVVAQTGDESYLPGWLILMLVSGIGLGCAIMYRRRSSRS